MQKKMATRPSYRYKFVEQLKRYSASRVQSFTKIDLQRILRPFEWKLDKRALKAEMVAAILQLKHDVIHNWVSMEGKGVVGHESWGEDTAAEEVFSALWEASHAVGVVKPVAATIGMREVSSQRDINVEVDEDLLLRTERGKR